MATVNFSVRMDADLKREVEAIYAELGMNLTSAVNAFLRQSVRVGGMPFDLRLNEQQRETVLAMLEAEQLASDPGVETMDVEDALAGVEALVSLKVVWTTKFKRDYKRAMKRGLDMNRLDEVIRTLAAGRELAVVHRDDALGMAA